MAGAPAVIKEGASAESDATDSFDIDSLLSNFLLDHQSASLELPCSLTPEQRKHAKQVVGQHPDLKCESFGMGSERRMHVFKCKAGDSSVGGSQISDTSPQCVNVKNTFIDDWLDANTEVVDNRNVQSMPHNMFGQSLSAELAGRGPSAEVRHEGVTPRTLATDPSFALTPERKEPVAEEQQFAVGTKVIIDGLVKAPTFNGANAVVQSWDAESGRYNVLLDASSAAGQRWAKIKAENLQRTYA